MSNIGSVRLFAVILLAAAAVYLSPNIKAQTFSSAALTGRVSSQAEGAMEGVLVSAKRDGSTHTITVVSDAQGQYSFPRARLEPGHYSLRIRAVGYELSGPASMEVTAQKPAQMDLKLSKAKDLAAQLTNSEWLNSIPGTKEQKDGLMKCAGCHTLERIFRSHSNAADLAKIVQRGSRYFENSPPESPQVMPADTPSRVIGGLSPEMIDFVTKVNLSSSPQWQYPLKTSPRPKGKSTRVIITEYDLPRKLVRPHDVTVDSKGIAWYCDWAHQFVGRLDPKTANIREFAVPVLKPDYSGGCRDIYRDAVDDVWISMYGQGAVAKFDRKTEKFQIWKLSKEADPDGNTLVVGMLPQYAHVDHKLWVLSSGNVAGRRTVERLDVGSSDWDEPMDVFKDIPKNLPGASRPHAIYEIFSDSKNNGYFSDFFGEYVGKIDAKTRAITFYLTPTVGSGPRRGNMDRQDRLWLGEFGGNRIGMFDTKTAKFQEWEAPTPYSAPYDAVLDKDGYVWTGGEFSDRVVRLNTKTNEMVEYMLPRSTMIQRVDVDNTTSPASLIVGNINEHAIVRVEPLDIPGSKD
jgi:streptogramin lyase